MSLATRLCKLLAMDDVSPIIEYLASVTDDDVNEYLSSLLGLGSEVKGEVPFSARSHDRVQTKTLNAPSKMQTGGRNRRPLSITNYVSLQQELKRRNNSEHIKTSHRPISPFLVKTFTKRNWRNPNCAVETCCLFSHTNYITCATLLTPHYSRRTTQLTPRQLGQTTT